MVLMRCDATNRGMYSLSVTGVFLPTYLSRHSRIGPVVVITLWVIRYIYPILFLNTTLPSLHIPLYPSHYGVGSIIERLVIIDNFTMFVFETRAYVRVRERDLFDLSCLIFI